MLCGCGFKEVGHRCHHPPLSLRLVLRPHPRQLTEKAPRQLRKPRVPYCRPTTEANALGLATAACVAVEAGLAFSLLRQHKEGSRRRSQPSQQLQTPSRRRTIPATAPIPMARVMPTRPPPTHTGRMLQCLLRPLCRLLRRRLRRRRRPLSPHFFSCAPEQKRRRRVIRLGFGLRLVRAASERRRGLGL